MKSNVLSPDTGIQVGASPRQSEVRNVQHGHVCRILLLNNERQERERIVNALQDNGLPFECLLATSSDEAIALLRILRNVLDAVVIVAPSSGEPLLQTIRWMRMLSNTLPIIVYRDRSDDPNLNDSAIASGASILLPGSLDVDRLISELEDLIWLSRQNSDPVSAAY
jgi:DNA-binding NarL/FixJ family response regulator